MCNLLIYHLHILTFFLVTASVFRSCSVAANEAV